MPPIALSAGSIVPGKPGYKEYVVKAKLSRERREQMKHDASEKGQLDHRRFPRGLRKALAAIVCFPIRSPT